MSTSTFLQWLITFAVTVVVEIVVAWPILGLVERDRQRRLLLIVGVNVLTHPIVFALAIAATSVTGSAAAVFAVVLVLELGASIVEALLYQRAIRVIPIAIAASFLANAASLFVCLMVWR